VRRVRLRSGAVVDVDLIKEFNRGVQACIDAYWTHPITAGTWHTASHRCPVCERRCYSHPGTPCSRCKRAARLRGQA
jgi:hypothetical protein